MAKPRCKKDHCLDCELEKCILDMTDEEYAEYKHKRRLEYYKERYRKNKDKKIAYNKDYYHLKKDGYVYNPQATYVKYAEIRKALTRVKKEIGEINYYLILDEFEKIDREMFRHG